MSDPVIQVDHVWKKFRKGEIHDSLRELIPAAFKRLMGKGRQRGELATREFWALKDVTFEVQRGESLGIIGPNGAGKSTMLKLLSRILKPNRGNYRTQGRVSALIEVGAGFHQDLTGRENIYLNGTILGMKRREIKAKEEAIIEFAGISDFIDTPVKRYSSGMGARLGFAIAAHMEPDVLLVDEVLSVGDARFRQKCVRHIRELVKSHVTVVFISHILDQVRQLCPRTIVLDHGGVVHDGDTNEAITRYLQLLERAEGEGTRAMDTAGEIRNIGFRGANGQEMLELRSNEPVTFDCQLVIHQRLVRPCLVINISSVGGAYLGSINSRMSRVELPNEPGRYDLRFETDPLPLADGDFMIEFLLFDGTQGEVVWAMKQPRMISVRGSGVYGPLIRFNGKWSVKARADASHALEPALSANDAAAGHPAAL